ncbi:ciliated left-right organizer metallopeptidase-like [Amphiura filiformis]|uniref:ciliated left-right organizer metallopeptidase-like n=1 Tax=Amphiura filiformis TaxID=82378 RepID=UPI003B21481B
MHQNIAHSLIVVLSIVLIYNKFGNSSPVQTVPCIFDEIQPKDVGKKTDVKYVQHKNGLRTKRAMDELYEPIRISWFIHDLDDYVDTEEVNRLTKVTRGAVSIIQKLLSVIPVSDPLLISRDACGYKHFSGPYQGECKDVAVSYEGEECLDDFTIPDDHLEGLWLWDDMAVMSGQPTMRYSNGSGLPNTDTVIYMKKQHTQRCADRPDIVAYALYCKQDVMGRPIAGVVNFCPNYLKDQTYDEDRFIVLTVHEIFHVLGFSRSLFDQFRECASTDCPVRTLLTTFDAQGQYRLITPAVREKTRQQFGCSDVEYTGGPLENQVAGDTYSSHWESRFMSGSIMAPTISKPHHTFLDKMTLAVFEDSGWYKVNYELAEVLPWGDNQGCTFGLKDTCQVEESDFFCNISGSSGCHYLHQDKATCNTNSYLEECPVYRAEDMGQCSVEAAPSLSSVDGEMYDPSSRCYVSTLSPQGLEPCHPEGKCYLTKCNQTSQEYQLKVGNGSWISCPERTDITIPGYNGVVTCPSYETICSNWSSILDLVDPCCPSTTPAPMPSTVMHTAITIIHSLCVSMAFGELEYQQVDNMEQQDIFVKNVRDTVCDTTRLMKNRVVKLEVGEEQTVVVVTFDIKEEDDGMQNTNMVSVQEAYQDLEMAVSNSMFKVPHMGENYTATGIRILSPSSPVTMPYTTNNMDGNSRNSTVSVIIGVAVGITMLLIVAIYICCKKNTNNAVGPAPDDEEMTPHRMYIVGDGSNNGQI